MTETSALDSLHDAISALKEANAIILNRSQSTRDPLYSWIKKTSVTIQLAEKAYLEISKDH